MARPRKDQEVETDEFGVPGDRAIPEEYEDHPGAWKRAYSYAANFSPYNGVKACVVFAESRWQDTQFQLGESE